MTSKPQIGDIWRYPYLWHWQAARGETEGRKPRPTALAAVLPIGTERTRLYLLPLTGTEPGADRDAIELPAIEIRRAGLTEHKRLWLIFDEHNLDLLEDSFYFEPNARIGSFSRAFVKTIARRFLAAYSTGKSARGVDRGE